MIFNVFKAVNPIGTFFYAASKRLKLHFSIKLQLFK